MATTVNQIASLFLADIGAPQTPNMVKAVSVWLGAENSNPTLRNNPWNLHQGDACGTKVGDFCPRSVLPGQTGVQNAGPNDKNVAVFSTIEAGVAANANNLKWGAANQPSYHYDAVIAAAQRSDPIGFLNALAASSWSGSKYSNGQGGNKLIDAYTGTTGSAGPMGPQGPPVVGSSTNPVADWWSKALGVDVNHVITQADYDKARAYFVSLQPSGPDFAGGPEFDAAFKTYIGKPISSLDSRLFGGNLTIPDLLSGGGNLGAKLNLGIGSVQDAVVFLGVILVGIVFIGSGAIITLKRQAA